MERKNIDQHGEGIISIHVIMLEMEIKTRWEDAVMASRVDDGSAAATGNGNMVCHGNINRNGRSLTHSLTS